MNWDQFYLLQMSTERGVATVMVCCPYGLEGAEVCGRLHVRALLAQGPVDEVAP